MGTLNLGTTGKIEATSLDLSTTWSNAPSGTIITSNSSSLSTAFSTTSDSNVDTGHSCSIVRKLAGGTSSGQSTVYVYLQGGHRDHSSSSAQDVTILYRSINGGSDSEQRYMDSKYGATVWLPHAAFYADASTAASAGDTVTYKMYVRSRGGSHTVHYHNPTGGVSQDVNLIVHEVVN